MNFGIDIYKHILAIFVIIMHMTSHRYSPSFIIDLENFHNYIDGAVAGFFLVSGYYFKEKHSFKDMFVKNFKRLIIPYFIFSIIYTFILSIIGKEEVIIGIIKTITFHGASMQLYFLPYLFFIRIAYWLYLKITSKFSNYQYMIILLALILLFICYNFPVISSTGSNYLLIPFYFLAFVIGYIYKILQLDNQKNFIYLMLLILFFIMIGTQDPRFYDLTFMLVLFHIFLLLGHVLPKRRFPGSGGVYLLHTPIINFSFSALLQKFGIIDFANCVLSVFLTYIFCLFLVYTWIRYMDKYRWIILE